MVVDILVLQLLLLCHVVRADIPEDYGEWGSWGEWSQCSVTCGYGSVRRNKNWIFKNGQVSNYTYSMIIECWTKVPCPVHGGWTMWTAWSECSKMCGGGNTTRTRLCIAPKPSENGRQCDGNGREELVCNNVFCPALPRNFDMSTCNASTFICKSELQCIPEALHCDNKLDCHDGSDEIPRMCRRFHRLRSGGCSSYSIPSIYIILVAVISVRMTTNHPV